MRSSILAAAMTAAIATVSLADGALLGGRQSRHQQCEIVTSNPIVIGDIWFEDGPYRSLDDARLARSTIGACPKDDPRAG
jgi:hypothetical protein